MNAQAKLLKNWTDSSTRYSGIVWNELNCFKKQAWTDLIVKNAGTDRRMDILDVGTGPGFFAIIMTELGHNVTAIDCTEAMVEEAQSNARRLGLEIDFRVSDAQRLDFPDNSFDLIISRNVAWTLIDAEAAYREWFRLLRPGGRTLIFDANWNIRFFRPEYQQAWKRDMEEYRARFPDKEGHPLTDEMIEYRKSMPQCQRLRPQWDFAALLKAGFARIHCDTTIWRAIYDESDQLLNRSTPMFMLRAEKEG